MRRLRYRRCSRPATCPLGLVCTRIVMAGELSLLGGRVVDGSEPPVDVHPNSRTDVHPNPRSRH